MPGGNETRHQRAAMQVARIRKLYSQIGEPLPADIIIDLHRTLGATLDALDDQNRNDRDRPQKRARA